MAGQALESPYVMNVSPAVLDPGDLRLAVSASVTCLALGLTFRATGKSDHGARVAPADSRKHSR
jgi:hypothetical protein